MPRTAPTLPQQLKEHTCVPWTAEVVSSWWFWRWPRRTRSPRPGAVNHSGPASSSWRRTESLLQTSVPGGIALVVDLPMLDAVEPTGP